MAGVKTQKGKAGQAVFKDHVKKIVTLEVRMVPNKNGTGLRTKKTWIKEIVGDKK